MNTKFRPPLLLIASLAIFLSVAEIVTHPAIAEAGSKIESAGKDMDGDPENYSDDSPKYINSSDSHSTDAPVASQVKAFPEPQLLVVFYFWFTTLFLRISRGI
jgi:hypothetical protein